MMNKLVKETIIAIITDMDEIEMLPFDDKETKYDLVRNYIDKLRDKMDEEV